MTAESTPPRRILVVDDDPPLLDAIERAFTEAGELVWVRGSFEQAKALLKQQSFDVLLTDVRLGAFNGLQLAVLARDLNPHIQLIVFSGFDDPVLRGDAERLGAVYLTKPVTSTRLIELIRERPR
jgi:DNA-binding NtrC family response regulator